MAFYAIVLMTVLTQISYKGSKVLISLYAIELGANPFTIGLLFAMYAVFPALLAVYAGKVSDRFGFRVPMLIGASGLVVGLLLPFLIPRLATLFVSAAMIGLFYIFYIVAVQHLVGSFGEGQVRTRNYSLFSLGVAVTSLLGPTTAGFSIDWIGYSDTYLLFSWIPLVPIAVLLFFSGFLPGVVRHEHATPHHERRTTDLLNNAPLRRLLIVTGVIETGQELFNFYMPIYGRSIGLSASIIGVIMGSYGAALLVARLVMPALVKRSSEQRVLSYSMLLAAFTCLAMPFLTIVPLLMLAAFVYGLGTGCCSPLSLILVYNRAPLGRSGEAIGLRQTVNKFTEVVMPVLFGSVGTALGVAPVFWGTALLLSGGGVLMRREARVLLKSVTRDS